MDLHDITKQAFIHVLKRHHSMKILIEFRSGLGSWSCLLNGSTLMHEAAPSFTFMQYWHSPVFSSQSAKASVNQTESCCNIVMTTTGAANHTFQFNLVLVANSQATDLSGNHKFRVRRILLQVCGIMNSSPPA